MLLQSGVLTYHISTQSHNAIEEKIGEFAWEVRAIIGQDYASKKSWY